MPITTFDRGQISFFALQSLPRDYARSLALEALGGAGYPPVPFLDVVDDARWWASNASIEELKAYGYHCFLAMPPEIQRAFLDWGHGQ
ncbi:hypothetical protein R3X27_23360 [Tropicimonas sp. TH_r6]|uniref:hypothetical protein n=1 Tax=Tropicimonas sp. TH_r6 TaxID=3082085 RepID=UPI002953C087|nr:hypothetical protein [Tropicimonas sp. TH_r6]MDV7145632.1 hypothetical protein [Tropicimonas sp. TH_r6]